MAEPDYLRRTRAGYDATAVEFAPLLDGYLADKPIDRSMLRAFAELVAGSGNRTVADVGCGTGATTSLLAEAGVDAAGFDLSPNMIAHARRLHPGLDFTVGSMTDLALPDGQLGGICAWYSIIHMPDDVVPHVFSEFHRMLSPGGYVLLAFQVGDRPRELTEAFGHRVDLTFHRRRPSDVTASLVAAGFTGYAQLLREPDANDSMESTQQAFLIVRKMCLAG